MPRNAAKTEPKALLQLLERLGRAEAAKQLGVSPSSFTTWTKPNAVARQPYELAARHILSKIDKDAAQPKVVLARVPADKLEMVRQFLDAVGAKHQSI